jgi:hypothetical protein
MSRNKTESLLSWTAYSVSRREKQPLLRFITSSLEMRGCRVIHASDPAFAPFYIVEHRFQIKYGSDLKTSLDVAIDPASVVTTIFLGIDLERGLFVAADPKAQQSVADVPLHRVQEGACRGDSRHRLGALGARPAAASWAEAVKALPGSAVASQQLAPRSGQHPGSKRRLCNQRLRPLRAGHKPIV